MSIEFEQFLISWANKLEDSRPDLSASEQETLLERVLRVYDICEIREGRL